MLTNAQIKEATNRIISLSILTLTRQHLRSAVELSRKKTLEDIGQLFCEESEKEELRNMVEDL